MNRCRLIGVLLLAVSGGLMNAIALADESTQSQSPRDRNHFALASSLEEARSRAKLLHEMVRGTLQIMHRDFFDEENTHSIPSASLEDVFHEMGESYQLKMKWLIVNTDVLNVDHKADTAFERQAVKSLASGKPFAEQVAKTTNEENYHFAGAIRLRSQCLKCHVKRRTTNEDRTAGLVISMPIAHRPK